MELDDLKKTWNLMDEQLKDRKLIRDEDITSLISKAGKNINELSRFAMRILLISVVILLIPLSFLIIQNGVFDKFYIMIAILAIPALGWDLYTHRFLKNTHVADMTPVEAIGRMNRYYRWMVWEGICGFIFVVLAASWFFIDREIWKYAPLGVMLYFGVWIGVIGGGYWILHHKILNRLREIRKNLQELKELEEIHSKL